MPSVELGRGNPPVVAPFFDELQIDVGGGRIAVIEFAAIDAEELQGLVEVGLGELGKAGVGGVGRG
jgi:hypothetical protein